MATFNFYLQGGADTEIEATDVLHLAGATFGSPIQVGQYNDSTHVKSSGGANDSSANTPNNVKFISQAGGSGGDSQADWGDGTEDLDQITDAECTLRIRFSHDSAVVVTDALFYAYNGTVLATAPANISIVAAERGDTNFTTIEGSGSPLTLNDKTSNTTHDYYIVLSASPDTVGAKTGNKVRIELAYV